MPCRLHTALTWRAFSIETGWPPPELLVTVGITSGMRSRPTRAMRLSSAATSMLPLNGCSNAGWRPSGIQIDRLRAGELHIGARGVEVRVVGNDVAFLARHAKQDALGGASLVRGNHVFVAKNILYGTPEAVEAAAAGVAFVAFHDGGPLVG